MRIAVIGTGMMGERMAGRLLDAGHDVRVFNRTREKTVALAARGATVAGTPRAAAETADVALTMLSDPDVVRSAAFGEDGLVSGLPMGRLWIDMSTVAPEDSREFAAKARSRGIAMIDAPVSGSLGAAERGLLVVVAGGAVEDVAAARPVLDVLGRATVHLGPSGAGSAAKLAINTFLCGSMVAAVEALRLGTAEGVDGAQLIDALARTEILPKWTVGKLERLRDGDTRPGFDLALAEKDLRLVAETAAADGIELPLAAAVRDLYGAALAAGMAGRDFSAVGMAAPGSGEPDA